MSFAIDIECVTAEHAETLREALRKTQGLHVEDEILAKAIGTDLRNLVCLVAATTIAATTSAALILSVLSGLGYNEITINGKVIALNLVSLEGAINAKKTNNDHSDGKRSQ